MKRKIIAVAIALAVIMSVQAFAAGSKAPFGLTGLGLYGSYGSTEGSLSGGLGLSFKFSSFPVVGLQYDFENGHVAGSVDYYAIDAEPIGGMFSFFLAAGAFIGVGSNGFDMGLRLPVGLQFWPVSKLEFYLSPMLSVPLLPAPSVGVGAEFGLRVHF